MKTDNVGAPNTTDQLGVSRPYGSACEIGASSTPIAFSRTALEAWAETEMGTEMVEPG